jgi:hypothetical protein
MVVVIGLHSTPRRPEPDGSISGGAIVPRDSLACRIDPCAETTVWINRVSTGERDPLGNHNSSEIKKAQATINDICFRANVLSEPHKIFIKEE